MSSGDKANSRLTFGGAAFIILKFRSKFRKRRQQREEKNAAAALVAAECKQQESKASSREGPGGGKKPPPLLRSRTLPAIVAPGFNIMQAQIDAHCTPATPGGLSAIPPYCSSRASSISSGGKRDSTASQYARLLTAPRISFTDDSLGERRVSDLGPNRDINREAASRSGRLSTCSIGSSQPLKGLARFLNQRQSYTPIVDEIPRRLSWERRDCGSSGSCLPRSSSIDSMAEWGLLGNESPTSSDQGSTSYGAGSGSIYLEHPQPRRSPSPLLGVRGDRLSIASPSVSRKSKGQRSVLALFTAVELGHLDKARTILETTEVDVNSVNSDGLSALDVAVLSNNRSLAKMLVAFGAQEGNQFKSPDSLGTHLSSLLSEAEHRVQELGGNAGGPSLSGSAGSSSAGSSLLEPPLSQGHRASFSSQHNNLTGCSGSAEDKQLALWERRARALRKMLLGFDQARPPDSPHLVTIDVTDTTSISAHFQESENHESPICTKFKLQWSTREDFSIISGEREVLDMKQKECFIDGLVQGQRYYFRAAAGNIKGYSKFTTSSPPHATPSSWRDIDGRPPRFSGRLQQLDSLISDIRGIEYVQETPAVQRRNPKKKAGFKQLFTATSKFQKNLRRGVFLCCLLYNEDKVLVTNEDFLPVIEVDDNYPSCIYNDFHWLMRVACTWDDVKSLRQEMEKSHTSSTNHLRIKMLQAAAQMQVALSTQDLGQFYHKPIRDVQGTLVFSCVNYVKTPKTFSVLNSKWAPIGKLTKKIITHEDSNVADILMASIQDQITYHQVSSIKLSRGLYLGYLKLQSSVDSIQVVVPAKSPNVLPHCKIRPNSHVSVNEWEYLKKVSRLQSSDPNISKESSSEEELQGSEQQKLFIDKIASATRHLLDHMEISPEERGIHRLYDAEVIDLTPEVSFLLIVPPPETACSVPGTRELLLQRGDLLSLPVQVFEMVHFNTYQRELISRYSRLSCILELDTAQAQHNHREAFSTSELNVAKDKLTRLQDLKSQMDVVWKGPRWLADVITFARDRGTAQLGVSGTLQPAGISMKHLFSLERIKPSGIGIKRSLHLLPPCDPKLVKSSPGRGSWPGPSVTNTSCAANLNAELSKSEQQLPSGRYVRKGSNTSNCSSSSEPYKSVSGGEAGSSGTYSSTGSNKLVPLDNTVRLPPSKSEDTLVLSKYKQSPRHRSATITSVSATTSPLLSIKPIMSSGTMLSGSAPMPNTASLLSVNNAISDSLRSISSDENTAPNSSVSRKCQIKQKIAKPTASIAAIATSSRLDSGQISSDSDAALMPAPAPPGILQVYAAYKTGLVSGTSLKLHVNPRTTAREVVDLIIKELNKTVKLRGLDGPVYTAEDFSNFCLVVVIGARERRLSDDFKVLQLQYPWKTGRLYVRQKHDVLAALEQSSKHTDLL